MAMAKNRSIHPAILLLVAACLFALPAEARYGGGAGEPNDPYLIYTAEQMNAIGADPNDWDKHFKLMADIDLSAYAETGFTVIRYDVQLINPPQRGLRKTFTGVFDGDDHTIFNYRWPSTRNGPAGLFESVTGPTGEIKNLILVDPEMILGEGSYGAPLVVVLENGTLTNCHIRGGRVCGTVEVGALTRYNQRGRIINCSVTADVEGSMRVGGLVGLNNGTIMGCHADGGVTGEGQVGGLAGLNEGSISGSYAIADVNGTDRAGGLIGYCSWGQVRNCYATGDITGKSYIGGLMGHSRIDVNECYATGSVTGDDRIGGLVGWSDGTIHGCHATGSVVGDQAVGGLIGGGYEVLNSYATGSVTGTRSVGGLIGSAGGYVENCHATGDVRAVEYAGGLTGDTSGRTVNSFATGDVTGNNLIGGLVGSNDGSITNCYATGSIHGPLDGNNVSQVTEDPCMPAMRRGRDGGGPVLPDAYAGGLVGENHGSILNSYSRGAVLRTRGAGGLVGVNRTDYIASGHTVGSFWDTEASGQTISAGGMGRTTAQMQTAATFLGWGTLDSQGAWTIDEGNDYPWLSWENKPGTLIDWTYPTGVGTQESPYQVHTPEELILVGWFPSQWGKHFELMADVDLAMHEGLVLMIGDNTTPFTGVFEGNGHTISSFSYKTEDFYLAGLFGRVADPNAQIRNLGLIDPNVHAPKTSYVGSLAGELLEGTITDCYARGGVVTGRFNVGGLVGINDRTRWPNESRAFLIGCRCTSRVAGEGAVGGLVGSNQSGLITASCASGPVTADRRAGGLVGTNASGTIADCYSTGTVTGNEEVGGLAGRQTGKIVNCYSTGPVVGDRDVGGLVGKTERFSSPSVTASFWEVDGSGQATSVGGIGLKTAAMKTARTFLDAGWDFVGETANGVEDVWWILEGKDYPRLFWELPGDR